MAKERERGEEAGSQGNLHIMGSAPSLNFFFLVGSSQGTPCGFFSSVAGASSSGRPPPSDDATDRQGAITREKRIFVLPTVLEYVSSVCPYFITRSPHSLR